jgi:ribonuclease HII
MKQFDETYPEYGFSNHVGYGTKAHYEAIKKHGACPLHRKSFRGVS